jgi:cytochrome P450
MIYLVLTPIIVVIIGTLLVKLHEYSSRQYIIDSRTKKPIANHVSFLSLIIQSVVHKKHVFQINYEIAKLFNFENVQQYFAHIPVLQINNVEEGSKVLLNWKNFEKAGDMVPSVPFRRFFGSNMSFMNGERYKVHRSVMIPAFKNIDRFGSLFIKEAFKCLQRMDSVCSDSNGTITVPISKFTSAMTLDILGAAAFRYDFDVLSTVTATCCGESEYVNAYNYILDHIVSAPYMLGGKLFAKLPLDANTKMEQALNKMDSLVYTMIKEARDTEGEHTLLDMMLHATEENAENQLTDEELRSNIILIFLAGHDTTSSSLTAALYLLAKHADVQDKLISDIDQSLGTDQNTPVSLESLQSVEYLEFVIKEVLRMYPPVVQIPGRKVRKTQQVGDVIVKKGALVAVSIYNIHHNPLYWNNPHEFRPERFSDEESQYRPAMAWMPFGLGARSCPGNKFSMLEQKIFLATLLQRYKVKLADNDYTVLKRGLLLCPDPTMKIVLEPRQ